MDNSRPSFSRAKKYSQDHSSPYSREQKTRLNFLLIGKTGQGKSATGNYILNKQCFPVCIDSNNSPEDRTVTVDSVRFDNYLLTVVEGPSLDYMDLVRSDNLSSKVDLMEEAFTMCYKGVNAFLFVLKVDNRFTHEDMAVFNTLKNIFGRGFLERVIVVMTCEDLFRQNVKEEAGGIDFTAWCRRQRGELNTLYRQCQSRFVLLNNNDTNENTRQEKINQLIGFVYQRSNKYFTYNFHNFSQAKAERDQQILRPERVEIVTNITSILADKEESSTTPSAESQQRISRSVQSLKQKLRSVDERFGTQRDLWKLIAFLELSDRALP